MSFELLNWFSYISIAFTIIPLIVGVICIKKIKNYLLPVFIMVVIASFVEIINFWVAIDATSNLPIFHIYTALEFSFIYLFYLFFYKQYFNFKILYLLIPLFYIVTYIDYKINGLNDIDSFSVTVESSIFIILSLISFTFLLRNLIYENVLSIPFFWINSGILIYFSGNILLFIFGKSLNLSDYYALFVPIHSPLNVIYNTLICIGFLKSRNV
jgi:hypothetical protein